MNPLFINDPHYKCMPYPVSYMQKFQTPSLFQFFGCTYPPFVNGGVQTMLNNLSCKKSEKFHALIFNET